MLLVCIISGLANNDINGNTDAIPATSIKAITKLIKTKKYASIRSFFENKNKHFLKVFIGFDEYILKY